MRLRHRKSSPAPALMLTSLLDMFTIILIFLIVSFDAESQNLHLNADIKLPESAARAELKPGIAVEITLDGVQMDGHRVVALDHGRATAEQYAAGEMPDLVTALRNEHERRYGDSADDAPAAGDDDDTAAADDDSDSDEDEAIVVVQADQRLDYKTIYLVLRSAARGGFFRYRLVIMKS